MHPYYSQVVVGVLILVIHGVLGLNRRVDGVLVLHHGVGGFGVGVLGFGVGVWGFGVDRGPAQFG